MTKGERVRRARFCLEFYHLCFHFWRRARLVWDSEASQTCSVMECFLKTSEQQIVSKFFSVMYLSLIPDRSRCIGYSEGSLHIVSDTLPFRMHCDCSNLDMNGIGSLLCQDILVSILCTSQAVIHGVCRQSKDCCTKC